MFDFEFSVGRNRNTASERAQERSADLLRSLFGGLPKEVPVTIRSTVEEDGVFGKNVQERTRSTIISLKPGMKLAKSEIVPTVFGANITTVVIENLDHLNLDVVTRTSETDTVFGKHIVTEVFIADKAQQHASVNPTLRERVTIRVSRPGRPR